MATDADRRATQVFFIRDLLTAHTGQILTPGLVDDLVGQFKEQTQPHWPMGWAFNNEKGAKMAGKTRWFCDWCGAEVSSAGHGKFTALIDEHQEPELYRALARPCFGGDVCKSCKALIRGVATAALGAVWHNARNRKERGNG